MNTQPISQPLRQFFGAYFHEDWVLEAEDWQGVVDGYVHDEQPAPELLRRLAHEIDERNSQFAGGDAGLLVTRIMGANYDPLPEMTYKEWLGQVAARLRQHADAIDKKAPPPTA